MAPGTREALVEAAVSLLDEGGPAAVTLREVGRRAGVSHNAPYKHFPSKEALLAAVAAAELRRQAETLTALAAGRPPREVLRAVMHDYIASALRHPARFKLVYSRWTIESDELASAAHDAMRLLGGLVVAAQESGDLPPGDPERLGALMRALAHGAADLASAGHLAGDGKGHAEPEDLVDDLLGHLGAAAAGPR